MTPQGLRASCGLAAAPAQASRRRGSGAGVHVRGRYNRVDEEDLGLAPKRLDEAMDELQERFDSPPTAGVYLPPGSAFPNP